MQISRKSPVLERLIRLLVSKKQIISKIYRYGKKQYRPISFIN